MKKKQDAEKIKEKNVHSETGLFSCEIVTFNELFEMNVVETDFCIVFNWKKKYRPFECSENIGFLVMSGDCWPFDQYYTIP